MTSSEAKLRDAAGREAFEGDIFWNIRSFLRAPENIKMTAAIFFIGIYTVILGVMVTDLAPANVPAYKAVLLPVMALAVLPVLYTRKLHGNQFPPFVCSCLMLTGYAFQAVILSSFGDHGYRLIAHISLLAVVATTFALRIWETKIKDDQKLLKILYWSLTTGIIVAGLCMRLLLQPTKDDVYCWWSIAGTSVQLSEILKLAFAAAVVIAVRLSVSDREKCWRVLLATAAFDLAMIVVNEGSAVLVATFVAVIVLFFCVESSKTLLCCYSISFGAGLMMLLGLLAVHKAFSGRDGFVATLYAFSDKLIRRVGAFLPDYLGGDHDSYQSNKAQAAFRVGGLFGSRSKFYGTVPEFNNDFALATLSSRLGSVVAMLIILAFVYIFLYAVRLYREGDTGALLITTASLLFAQSAIAIASNLNLIPIAGLNLPYISTGGSSTVVFHAVVTVILICMAKNSNDFVLREEASL